MPAQSTWLHYSWEATQLQPGSQISEHYCSDAGAFTSPSHGLEKKLITEQVIVSNFYNCKKNNI